MFESAEKNGEEVNPCSARTTPAMHLEEGQGMDHEQPGMVLSRECVERQLESLDREREGLVEEVKGLQAQVLEIKLKLEVEDGTLPHEQGWDKDSHSRIQRLEQRAKAEEQRLAELQEKKENIADDVSRDLSRDLCICSGTEEIPVGETSARVIELQNSANQLRDLPKRKSSICHSLEGSVIDPDKISPPQVDPRTRRRKSSITLFPERIKTDPDPPQRPPPPQDDPKMRRRKSSISLFPGRISTEPSAPETPKVASESRRRRSSFSLFPSRITPVADLPQASSPVDSPGMRGPRVCDRQPSRLGIEVVGIQVKTGTVLTSCFVKLVHETLKEKTETVSGQGYVGIHYKCSLEEKEKHLGVELRMRKTGHLHSKVLGTAWVDVGELDTIDNSGPIDVPAPILLTLLDQKGQPYEPVECLILRIVKVRPPGPNENMNVLVGTWNLGDAAPPSVEVLQHWLQPAKVQQAGLVVVGTQECLYKRDNVDGVDSESAEQDWVQTLSDVIGETHTVYQGMSLGKTRICVWVRFDILAGIHHYQAGDKGTGYPVPYSSKGGVAALLSVWDTTIVFVNSHLAAHIGPSFLARRNQDYSDIAGGISLGNPNCGLLNQFHHCIWLGDLNYRLDFSDTFGEAATEMKASQGCHDHVVTLIRQKKFQKLLENDELIAARQAEQAFVGFEEAPIRFPPTFKVSRRASISYKAQRIPAYTDRIMWRSLLPSLRTRCIEQWIAESVDTSDHKPVAALLQLDLRPPRPEWWRVRLTRVRHHPSHAIPIFSGLIPMRGGFGRTSSVASHTETFFSRAASTSETNERIPSGAEPHERMPSEGQEPSVSKRVARRALWLDDQSVGKRSTSLEGEYLTPASPSMKKPGKSPKFFKFSSLSGANSDGAQPSTFSKNFRATFKTLAGLHSHDSDASGKSPGCRSVLQGWKVHFTSLCGAGLSGPKGLGKSANPYVTFYSDVLASPVQSDVARNTLSPTWACNDLSLSLAAPNLEDLQWEYIVLSVMHKTRVGTPDIPMGVGVILVEELKQNPGEEVNLIVPLLGAGVPKGCVLCTLKMEPARRPTAVPQFRKQRHKILLKHSVAHQHDHSAAQQRASCWPFAQCWISKGTHLTPRAGGSSIRRTCSSMTVNSEGVRAGGSCAVLSQTHSMSSGTLEINSCESQRLFDLNSPMTPLPRGLAESQRASPTGSLKAPAVDDASNRDPAATLEAERIEPPLGAVAIPANDELSQKGYKPVSGEDIVLAT